MESNVKELIKFTFNTKYKQNTQKWKQEKGKKESTDKLFCHNYYVINIF